MMSEHAIFVPMGVLALATAAVGLAAGIARGIAIQRGDVAEEFYELFQGGVRPEFESRLTRHYHNLLELPILYYAAGLAIQSAGVGDATFVGLFWLFLPIRLVHAAIHLSYNRVTHRAAAFGAGAVLVVAIWVRFLVTLSTSAA